MLLELTRIYYLHTSLQCDSEFLDLYLLYKIYIRLVQNNCTLFCFEL